MKILFKQVTISDANSEINGTTPDILIDNGKITAIQHQLNIDADQIIHLPNAYVSPIIQNKAQIEYITNTSNQYTTIVHALGAISKNIEGKELAEMYEMHHAGA
jgi:dihydroorotase